MVSSLLALSCTLLARLLDNVVCVFSPISFTFFQLNPRGFFTLNKPSKGLFLYLVRVTHHIF